MRKDRACVEGTRSSALWGRGSKSGSRSSALWGRRGGRTAAAFTALTFALALPASGIANDGKSGSGDWKSIGGTAIGTLPLAPTSKSGGGNDQQGTQQENGRERHRGLVSPALENQANNQPDQQYRVIIQGVQGSSSKLLESWVKGNGNGRVKNRFHAFNGLAVTLSGKDLLKLSKFASVLSITPDRSVPVSDYENAEMWRDTTGVTSFLPKNAVTCAVSTLTGLPLNPTCVPQAAVLAPPTPAIAIVDSGIDASKAADFGARVVARSSFVSTEPNVQGDPEGHGTMVAGLAAGGASNHIGAAPRSNLVDVRVADSQGLAYTSDIIAGLDWVLANKDQYGIRVVNMSLAGTAESSITFDPLDKAVEKLWLNGLTVVAAAGNHGQGDTPVPMPSPGNDPFVITVGALDQNQTPVATDDVRAPWSAFGHTMDGFAKPELSAPGRYMISPITDGAYLAVQKPERVTAPGYMWMSGTSFAAPVVAGVAAQLLAQHPDWTPNQVKGALMVSAQATATADVGVGIGEVNAEAASAVVAPPNPNENLYQFVTTDLTTGLLTFNPSAWADHIVTDPTWTAANWTSANWTSANWTSANWTSANWTSANWTSANWTSANWTSANWTSANWTAANWVS